ncbi:MAG: HDIG domain-containing metalloprotein [Candidatus Thorarchaeota archaeon]
MKHCQATEAKALEIAKLVSQKFAVDLNLIHLGALLHDIGRASCHDVTHGYVGGQLLKQNGYPLALVKIVERHVLGGFTAKQAYQVGLPKRTFVPSSWEEKIVCVADKLGLYRWSEIDQPNKWLTKMDARIANLQKRYDLRAPFKASIERARRFTKTLANIALSV